MYYTIYILCTTPCTLLNLGKHLNMVHTSSKEMYKEFYFQLHKGQTVEEQLIGSCGWLTHVSDLVLLLEGTSF